MFSELVVSCAATFQWHGLFTSGKKFVKDEERRGSPTTTNMFENIARVEQVLKKDRPVSCKMILESIGIPKTIIVQHILRDDLKKESWIRTSYHRP